MNLPKIGDPVTTEYAIELCQHFGFDYLVERLEAYPEDYKEWVFDGASMIPDNLFSKLFKIPNLTEIALRHDLKYAYGASGDNREKLKADLEFALEVLNDGASAEMTKLMFTAVDVGGKEILKTSFSWGFARKKKK
ncbi:MAG: hypothetical protein JXK94_07930 [Deltaproteobacteria bacterium]|nr:hypothetical protein [Deltaproteobacteria bacterium]